MKQPFDVDWIDRYDKNVRVLVAESFSGKFLEIKALTSVDLDNMLWQIIDPAIMESDIDDLLLLVQ